MFTNMASISQIMSLGDFKQQMKTTLDKWGNVLDITFEGLSNDYARQDDHCQGHQLRKANRALKPTMPGPRRRVNTSGYIPGVTPRSRIPGWKGQFAPPRK